MLRFDTQGAFGSGSAWSVFDLTTVDARATSFRGAVFDGRYVYLVPSGAYGIVSRLDTQAPFTSAASWTTFQLTNLNPALAGFTGATFDGGYVRGGRARLPECHR